MEIVQVVGFGVIAAVSILFIRQSRPDIAHLLSIGAGVVIVVYVLGYEDGYRCYYRPGAGSGDQHHFFKDTFEGDRCCLPG